MSKIDLYKVFDVIEFEHYVQNGGEYKAQGIVLFDMKKNCKYLFCLVHDETFYISKTISEIRGNIKTLDIREDVKIDMIQEANYISHLNYMKSRWFKEELTILYSIRKSINKKKKGLAYRFRNEYIAKTKTKYTHEKCQYIAYIFILNFTKSKIVNKNLIKSLPIQ